MNIIRKQDGSKGNKEKLISTQSKIVFVCILVVSIICFVKLYNYIQVGKYAIVKENANETEGFTNFRMKDNTLIRISEMVNHDKEKMSKLLTVAFVCNEYNLEEFDSSNINIRNYNKIYKNLKKSDLANLQSLNNAIEAIIKDIKYFPVADLEDEKYTVSYVDSFGARRNYNGSYPHEGCDIMAGTNIPGVYPIVSICDGYVQNVGWLEKGGYRIGIKGKSGGYFYYAHLSENNPDIKEGDFVKAGQIIGYMGNTGYGPEGTNGKFPVHLHLGIYIQTQNYKELAINPYYVLQYLETKKKFRL